MADSLNDTYVVPISALQHFAFCPRQYALIHLEQQWNENHLTAEGRVLHERVDRPEHESRHGIRMEYAVDIKSSRLGLIGKADCVVYEGGRVRPLEFKRGRPKPNHCDWIQLCAQALCLEEMMGIEITDGEIFYGQPRRRQQVYFDDSLRMEMEQVVNAVHRLFESGITPHAVYNAKKCGSCSLFEICMPRKHRSVNSYIQESLKRLEIL